MAPAAASFAAASGSTATAAAAAAGGGFFPGRYLCFGQDALEGRVKFRSQLASRRHGAFPVHVLEGRPHGLGGTGDVVVNVVEGLVELVVLEIEA